MRRGELRWKLGSVNLRNDFQGCYQGQGKTLANARPQYIRGVSMGLTVNRRKRYIFTVNRQASKMQIDINRYNFQDISSLTMLADLHGLWPLKQL